jgi:predicted ribosomally synthesized peptide with nif11-like leader
MSKENLEKFYEAVMAKPALQESLRNSPDLKGFTELVVRLGAQEGLAFTTEEVSEKLAANTQLTSAGQELTDQQLEMASGGAISWGNSYWCGACGATSASAKLPM